MFLPVLPSLIQARALVAKRRHPCYNRWVIETAPSPDWTIPQDWAHFTTTDHGVWDHLFDRQTRLLPGRVAPEFLDGLKRLDLTRSGVPNFCPVER